MNFRLSLLVVLIAISTTFVRAQYLQVNDIPYADAAVRPDAPPMVIISGDRELELFGRYEEQAYFWRMLKLAGHKDVTLYEMQGFNHGDMPHPAYHVLKEHIKRLTRNK